MRSELAITIGRAGSYQLREQRTTGSTSSAQLVPSWLLPLLLQEMAGHGCECVGTYISPAFLAQLQPFALVLPFPGQKGPPLTPLLHDEKAHLHMQQHGALNSPLQNRCLTSACLLYLDDVSRQRFLSVCMEGPHSSHLTRPQMVSYLKADIFRLGVNYPL